MRGPLAVVVTGLVAAAAACGKGAPSPAPAASEGPRDAGKLEASAGAIPSASSPPGIGPLGGAVVVDGAKIVVPPGALASSQRLTIRAASKEELAAWPRGTARGFLFGPPELRFRIPITIELPHDDPAGEVMCEEVDGERHIESFDAVGAAPFRVNAIELPKRCAVYSMEHMRARQASKAQADAVVAKQNRAFKWQYKGNTCDPRELSRPNAGKDLREPPGENGCRPGMTKIAKKGTCIDRWEAHVVEILEDSTERTWSPYFNPAGIKLRAKSAPGAVPQGYISQPQAAAACKETGKRLCTDEEWVLACKGASATLFPYGAAEKQGTCNDHRDAHPAAQYLEKSDLTVFSKLDHPCINQLPDTLLLTGEKKECHTPEGVYDMVGNVHEWTADPKGTFRGGYYVETNLNGRGCDYATTAHGAEYWDYSTGFRCCAD